MKPAQLKTKKVGRIFILFIVGEVDLNNALNLKSELDKTLSPVSAGSKVLLNLSKLNYIDSAGLGSLLSTFSQLKKRKIHLKMCSPNAMVRSVLSLMNMDTLFALHDNQEVALRSFEDDGVGQTNK